MYRKSNSNQMVFDFHLPFGGELNPENRWIVLANVIPWDQIDSEYATLFDDSDLGCPGKPSRVALGALIIKERLKLTDRETVDQIRENPYLQYFLGFSAYTDEPPFHHTSMVHFRKRFGRTVPRRLPPSRLSVSCPTSCRWEMRSRPAFSGLKGGSTGPAIRLNTGTSLPRC